MYELPPLFPDVETVLAFEPEELAAKILFLMKQRLARETNFLPHCGNLQDEPFGHRHDGGPIYPRSHRGEFHLAFSEAWSWLEVQGLLIPAPGMNGTNGFRLLSRRARRLENELSLERYATARRLPRESLNPLFRETVWSAFIRGEYDVAVFQAMKAVEVAVRAAANLPTTDVGVRLMRKAFDPKIGPLTDINVEEGEREALSALFAGSIGSYKNPHSHRRVPLDDPAEAIEIVLLANHLLRIVETRQMDE